MNQGLNPPSGGQPGGKGRRRRRGRRGPVTHASPAQPGQHPGQQRHGPPKRHGRKPGAWQAGQNQTGGGVYSAPMDHSYRAAQGTNDGNTHRPARGGRPSQTFGKQFLPPEPEPLPVTSETTPARIFAFVDDLFRSEEHTSELQSPCNLVCGLLLEIKNYLRHQPRSETNSGLSQRATNPS